MQQAGTCLFCGHYVQMVHVHGHYQCPVCFTNAMPCCDGDNCDTNKFLTEQSKPFIEVNSVKLGESVKIISNETGL
jgi:hypothetical protein